MPFIVSKIDLNVSRNFNVAKTFSILVVILGHYFKEFGVLHIPVTVGLLIFSYSSGYFTNLKYQKGFSKKEFWQKKAERLFLDLVTINVFLLIVFLIQRKPGILSWQTVVNVAGLNGFLNWFHIRNPSPFGHGMWFFTLLLIFYFFYPALEYINRRRYISYFMTTVLVVSACYLNTSVVYGHALWLTICGFVLGVFSASNDIRVPGYLSMFLCGLVLAMMLWFNYSLGIKAYNSYFTLILAISCIFSIKEFQFPRLLISSTALCSGCLLQIYLIHTYLFMEPTGYRLPDFAISLFVILFSAKILQMFTTFLKRKWKNWFVVVA